MKIDLTSIDQEQFMVHQHVVNGEVLHLVQPQHIGAKWNRENKIFRSSLWNNEGELVSAGFQKFTNWGENPDNFPVPTSLKNTTITEKVDGSLLIVSKYKGHVILRTRGTSDATKIDNGHELKIFKEKYLSKLTDFTEKECGKHLDTWNVSTLFEWVSPNQKIILNYGDNPEWYLVGAIGHADYSLASQDFLNAMAKDVLSCPRPVTYTFPNVEDLMKSVEEWKGKEGVVVYSNDGQSLHKCKSAWYLALHRMKEEFGSIERLIDVWFSWECPDYQTTETKIVSQFDFELFQTVRGDISKICDAWKEVQKIKDGMQKFVQETLLPLGTRKEQALKVLSAYGTTNRASFIFKLLDKKPLARDDEKKLLYQVLKK
jgi:hypothetical protein